MIVVIEGPDGAGKTTLARALVEAFGLEYRHEGPPPLNRPPLAHYLAGLMDAVLKDFTSPGVVIDRFALGERVYGPAYRSQDRLGEDGWREVRDSMVVLGVVQVVCLPPWLECVRAWAARKHLEMLTSEQQLEDVYRRFEGFATSEACLVRYDWTDSVSASDLWAVLYEREGRQ